MARKIAHIVYFDAEPADWLRAHSEESGIAVTEIVRRAVAIYRAQSPIVSPKPNPDYTGTLCPGRHDIREAAREALDRGLITSEQFEEQVSRLAPPADRWTNLRVLRDFTLAPAAEVTLEIARAGLRAEYPNATIR